jgi:Chromo (CHRromatin Organisation MOdifier) domain
VNPAKQKQAFLERLKSLRKIADGRLSEAQERYKRTYDRGVPREKNAGIPVGGWAYVRAEVPETGRSHNLDSLVHGPYEVVENDSHTFRLRMGSDVVRISSDRITPAPGKPRTTPQGGYGGEEESVAVPRAAKPSTQEPGGGARKTQGKRNERGLPRGVSGQTGKRVRWTPEVVDLGPTRSTEEYVIDRLVGEGRNPKGRTIYRVRWLGYYAEEGTWELAEHLPDHFIRRYLRA